MATRRATASTLAQLGERGLIARIARRANKDRRVVVGIGDDAAVLPQVEATARGLRIATASRTRWLFASDMLVENVHFRRRDVPAAWIGWKALACNVSDIAAMGGWPAFAVVSLATPSTIPVRWLDELQAGLQRCARRFDMDLVGGDTVRGPCVVIDVAILGAAPANRVVLRSGAVVGDHMFVTGRLGGSLASGRHARFMPRVREAQALLDRVPVHAMMDLSDGLASDAWQLARASRVTIRLDEATIPVSRAGRTVQHALMDGEDFELLFAVAERHARRVPRSIVGTPVTPIGRVVRREAGVEWVRRDGHVELLHPAGFHHF